MGFFIRVCSFDDLLSFTYQETLECDKHGNPPHYPFGDRVVFDHIQQIATGKVATLCVGQRLGTIKSLKPKQSIGEDDILDCMEPKEDGSEWDYIPGDDDWSTLRSSNHPSDVFMLW